MSQEYFEQIIVVRHTGESCSDGDLQEFTDQAITDPKILAEVSKRRRRPIKLPRWFWPVLLAGSVAVALAVGVVLGHFIL